MTSPQLSEALEAVDITSMPRYLQHGYPWADWDLLRDAAPVYWYAEGRPRFSPFWAVTRYDDVRFVSSHPELFSNRGVIRVDTDNGLARLETYKRKRAERYGWEPNVALDMIYTDRPEHLDLRSMAVRRFTPRAMNRLADHLDQMAQHFVAELVAAARRAAPAPIDVVENLSVGLPIATICGLLGVPVDTWPTIRRWSDQTLLTPDMSHPDVRPGETPSDVRRRAGQEYHEYRQQLIDRARAAALAATATTASGDDGGADGFDIVSRLAQATVNGHPLDDQRFPSANRDDRQFPDPYRFDLRRYPNAHVTFGHGEHFCLGANLARWELQAVFRALAPHLANLRLAGEPERMPGLHVRAVRQLLVRWTTEQ